MNEEELAAARLRHGSIKRILHPATGDLLAVVRGINLAELDECMSELGWQEEENIALKGLVWPDAATFKATRNKLAFIGARACAAVRDLSGEGCKATIDHKSGSFVVHRMEANPETGAVEKKDVYRGGCLGWSEYQRWRTDRETDALKARRVACVDAGTFPESREQRLALFDRLPLLTSVVFGAVLELSGGTVDVEGN